VPYCSDSDLLTGPLGLPESMDVAKYVQDAADEIDTQIGFVYQTPVVGVGAAPLPRPVSLLLKRINALLASGRAIIAAGGGSQDTSLNAYGRSLVDEARAALTPIVEGRTVLEGAERLPDQGEENRGPRIYNIDSESPTDAFYGYFSGGGDIFAPAPFYGMRGADPHSG
jgi:hypothetical protein